MNKKKIYISLPIAFQEDTVYPRNNDATVYLSAHFRKYEWVSPIDTNHIDEEALGNHLAIEKTAYYMGKDIEALLECDAIYLCEGWQNSKGCMAEFEVARIYGKEIIFER